MGRQLDERLVFLATCHHIYSVINDYYECFDLWQIN